jgi:GH24 family phage-related lysozyme (muramidase)
MKRLWQSDPALAGLVARREQEAILFEAGLAEAAG